MLDNCKYNKVKILHEISSLIWFLEKHAISDAQQNHDNCEETLKKLKADLEKYIMPLSNDIQK